MQTLSTQSERAGKLFPLRLCEVLEEEFITTHGPLPEAPSWLLRRSDVNFAALGGLLQSSLNSASTTPLGIIREKLQVNGVVIPATGLWPDDDYADIIIQQINRLLVAPEILYDHNLLDRDTEGWQLAELWASRPNARSTGSGVSSTGRLARAAADDDRPAVASTREIEQVELNRILLDAAFPSEVVARVDTSRLTRLFDAIGKLGGPDGTYSAICLSGGGIRSAAFSLGVLQALARAGLLEKFDFLSTVSGGGYVGSWLTTWIHRHPQGLTGVITDLSARARPEAIKQTAKIDPAPPPVGFLRSYSHFLNPQAGLLTVDTWTWIGIYLRNLALNWLVLIPLLLFVVALPRLYSSALHDWAATTGYLFPALVWAAAAMSVLAIVCVTVNRPSTSDPARPDREAATTATRRHFDRVLKLFKHQGWLLGLGVLPIVLFAVLFSLMEWGFPSSKTPLSLSQLWVVISGTPLTQLPSVLAFLSYDYIVVWGEALIFVSWILAHLLLPARDWKNRVHELIFMLLAGFLTWTLVASLADFAFKYGKSHEAGAILGPIHPAHFYAVFAVPIAILSLLAGMTLFVGLVSKLKWIEDEDREWWARFGSWILIAMAGWTLLSAITIFGPPLLLQFPKLLTAVGGASGLLVVLLGKSSLTSATRQEAPAASAQRGPLRAYFGVNLLPAVGAIFVIVLLAFLSLATSALLRPLLVWLSSAAAGDEGLILTSLRSLFGSPPSFKTACGLVDAAPTWLDGSAFRDPTTHLQLICQTPLNVIAVSALALALLVIVASLAINLNKFSLHAAYRIRLVRTFLGASRGNNRQPNPFTGFDPMDDVQMHELQPGLIRETEIVNLSRFVQKLHAAHTSTTNTPAKYLIEQMCSPARDRDAVLRSRLGSHRTGAPVLKSLEQDVLEALNRVIETDRLDTAAVFQDLRNSLDPPERAAYDKFIGQDSIIFANRLLVDRAFPDDIKKYPLPPPPPHKLVHIVNLTINLVHGRRLAWQERKAAPFIVTPMHSGSYYLGYRKSRNFGGKDGISVGTAVAVSGAAVSPNMGYSSSPLTALLLTLFNVRLGWWLGNPGIAGTQTYSRSEPRFSLRPLLSEALGLTDDLSPYIYLSDGGHFENMGLFEMVLRRCQLIICTDAGADPEYQFADIGNAVRKIRIDLGIPIDFDSIPVHQQRAPDDDSGRYCYMGRIRYSCVDGSDAPDGVLICFKPVLRGKEPQDILNYHARNKVFPQEPTLDQFFGESQFESYRQLGEFAVETVLGNLPPPPAVAWAAWAVEQVRTHLGAPAGPHTWIDAWLDRVKGSKNAAAL